MRRFSVVVVAAMCLGLSACTSTAYFSTQTLSRTETHPRILMMPPDVDISELQVGGSLELNAEWTLAGRENLIRSVQQILQQKNIAFVPFQMPPDDSPQADAVVQLQKLQSTVAQTILRHKGNEMDPLPTKANTFDWSLGPQATYLAPDGQADYALFVFMRDSYSSPGRIALRAVGAVLGMRIPGGLQSGAASLVDLKTGDVVWLNIMIPRTAGDLRNAADAGESVELLLQEMPK